MEHMPVQNIKDMHVNGSRPNGWPYDIKFVDVKVEPDEDNLPLNSIKNIGRRSKTVPRKRRKKHKEWIEVQSVTQKENVALESRRYGLRCRKKVSFKEDDFHDLDSESETMVQVKSHSCPCLQQSATGAQIEEHNTTALHPCLVCRVSFCTESYLLSHCCSSHIPISQKYVQPKSIPVYKRNTCNGSRILTCDICKNTYSNMKVLQNHITAHFNNKRNCKKHGVKLKSLADLGLRFCGKPIKQKKFKNKCHLCQKVFPQPSKLKIHLLRHEGITFKCSNCNRYFVSGESLQEHKVSVDCSLTVHRCQQCGKIYKDVTNYNKHLLNHKDNVMKCYNCKKVFLEQNKFSEHVSANDCLRVAGLSHKLKYECDACGNLFARLVKLQIHILNDHLGINHQCSICSVKFTSREDLDLHLAEQGCKAYGRCVCKVCGKIFAKPEYLKKHEYMHSNVFYKCSFCYCAFIKSDSFKRHTDKMNCSKSARKIKLGLMNFKKCRLCAVEFEEEENLIQHFSSAHPQEKPQQCFCCADQLDTFEGLQAHIHQHNTQKYTCNLCGKPYTSQEGFRKHRLKHKGAELKCKFCDAEFLNESRFHFHQRTCKKNPECGYDPTVEKPKRRKEQRPKQSRQLHWESRIIMKRLRNHPTSSTCHPQEGTQLPADLSSFFDEPDSDSQGCGERGWFDNYYKTELDDLTFGVSAKRDKDSVPDYDSDFDVTEFLHSGSIVKKCKDADSVTVESRSNHMEDEDSVADNGLEAAEDAEEESNAGSSGDSSSEEEEEDIEEVQMPGQYNPKWCRICDTGYSQEYELLHHFIKTHSGQMAHRCPNCEECFPLFAQLKEHMKIHGIGMGVFNCDNCSKKFKSERKMRSHNLRCKGLQTEVGASATAKGETKLELEELCKRCGKKFQTKCGYRRHKRNCKMKNKPSRKKKSIAKAKSVEKSDEEEWRNDVSGGESEEEDVTNVECDEVKEKAVQEEEDKDVNTKSKLLKVNSEAADDDGNNKNPVPKLSSEIADDGKEKSVYFIGPPLDSFPCRMCDKKFQYERGLVMHFKSEHPNHKPLICHVCNMHLADKLKEHLKTHGIGEEFICELCGKRFNQKFLSKIHEMWHQGVEFKCANCKQKFLNKEKMDKHVSENRCSKRQSLMQLPCHICGRSYRSKFGLSKHLITHTPKELRPVKNRMNCEFCGKWFDNNNGLQRHRRIHTGERPFCCRFCPKAFAQDGNCKAHERIHTGESRPKKKNAKVPSTDYSEPALPVQDPIYVYSYMPNASVL